MVKTLTTHLFAEWSCAGAATEETAKVARTTETSNFMLAN